MVTSVLVLAVGCSNDGEVDAGPTETSAVAEQAAEVIDEVTTTSRAQTVSIEPDGVLAEEVFSALSEGFVYVFFTDQQVRELRNDFFGGDVDTILFLRDFTARKIQRGNGPESLIIVYVVDPVAARDSDWQRSLQDGFTQGAESSLIVIGTQSLTEVENESGIHLLWRFENTVLMFHGVDRQELYAAAYAVMEPLSGPFPTTTASTTTTTTTLPETTTSEADS